MENAIGLGGEKKLKGSLDAPASAKAYYHQVLAKETETTLRNKREEVTLCHILDHLALGRAKEAADVCAQRLKSVQLASKHGNWDKSRFIELVPMSDGDLADPSEKKVANKSAKENADLDQGSSSSVKPWNEFGKNKGPGKKGQGKGHGKGNAKDDDYNWIPYWPKKKGNPKGGGKKGAKTEKVKYDKDGNPI